MYVLPMAVKYVGGASTLRHTRNQGALPLATISSDLRGVPSLSVIEGRRLLCRRASTSLEIPKHAAITRYPLQRYCRVSIPRISKTCKPHIVTFRGFESLFARLLLEDLLQVRQGCLPHECPRTEAQVWV